MSLLARVAALAARPDPFVPTAAPFWDDPYISARLLRIHLDDVTDAASRPGPQIRAAVDRLVRDGVVGPGSRVLDLGCGPGRYAELLAAHGCRVTGIDRSERSLAYARARAAELGLDVDYRHEDFRELADVAAYDVVLQVFGELNTFGDDVRDDLLGAVHRALVPGGLLVCDLSTPALARGPDGRREWSVETDGLWRPGTCLVLTDAFDYPGEVHCDQYVVVTDEPPGTTATPYRMWFRDYVPETIRPVLDRAGFDLVDTWEGLAGGPYRGGPWLGVVARAR